MPVELFRIFVTVTVLCLALYAIFTAFSVFTCEPYERYRRFKDCLVDPGGREGMGVAVTWFFNIILGVVWLGIGIYHLLFG